MNTETLKLGIIDRLMKIQNPAALKRMDELITKAEFEDIKNSGHYPNQETPVYLATVLEKFLEK